MLPRQEMASNIKFYDLLLEDRFLLMVVRVNGWSPLIQVAFPCRQGLARILSGGGQGP
jgi:hypothetical protein